MLAKDHLSIFEEDLKAFEVCEAILGKWPASQSLDNGVHYIKLGNIATELKTWQPLKHGDRQLATAAATRLKSSRLWATESTAFNVSTEAERSGTDEAREEGLVGVNILNNLLSKILFARF